MARVVEGDARTGTWARPTTPAMETGADGQFVSKGWNELDHKGWVFKARTRPPSGGAALADLRDALALGPVPLPEKVYAENLLECSHGESGIKIAFTAAEALAGWHSAQQKELGGGLSAENFDRHFNTPYAGSIVVSSASAIRCCSHRSENFIEAGSDRRWSINRLRGPLSREYSTSSDERMWPI